MPSLVACVTDVGRFSFCVMLQTRLAGELEQHKLRLLGAFDNLHSRIMDAKTLAAAACKPVRQQDKVLL